MKITIQTLKKLIKEELENVLNEDLYASNEEYEEAIKDFMKLHDISREEAKQAIDAAGDEMDRDHPMHGRYIEKEKTDINNYKSFLNYASIGEGIALKDSYTEDDILDLIYDFKSNYKKYKNKKPYDIIVNGYEYCLSKTSTLDVREPRGEKDFDQTISKFGTELAKTEKPLMNRDLTALSRMRKSEEEFEQLINKRDAQCEKKLGFALLYAHLYNKKKEQQEKIKQRELQRKQKASRSAQEKFEKYGVKKGEVLEALRDVAENYKAGKYWIDSLFKMVDYLMVDYGTDLNVKTPGYDGLEKRLRRAIFDVRANGNYDALSRMHTMIEKLYEKETAKL